ncbi:MAG: NAD(P)/FAD-dependent oxidoreductase [candidate division Zixibacteria bacterium]|nr:NAD(P)/FAD-dependent oxidoreductase [candidate division Zixibacteria bacterium]
MFSTKDVFDMVVVGGGPGGAMAAWAAAERGIDVLMIEKDREIGVPVRCAEGIAVDTVHRFLDPAPHWISAKIEGVRLYAPSGASLEFTQEGMGYVLERRVFDRELANRAAKAGAEVRISTCATGLVRDADRIAGVRMVTRGREYTVQCPLVIAADGVESRVARWAGINTLIALRDLEVTTQYLLDNVRPDKGYCEFFLGQQIAPGGYAWIFPKSSDTANVGIGVCGRYTRHKSSTAYLHEFIERRFPDSTPLAMVVGSVPVAHTLDEIFTDGLMVVGDAAHQVNPISGGGIGTAMIAGEIAGRVGAEAIKTGDVSKKRLAQYRKDWDEAYGNHQRRVYRVKEAINKLKDATFDATAERLGQKDRITLREVFLTALRHQPGMLIEVVRMFARI